MEKIKLNDGTLLEIQSGATEYNIQIQTDSVDEVANTFTDTNLERYEILTEDGAICAIYTKKHLKKLSAEIAENGFIVTVMLEDVNEIYERVKTLEATVETLQAEIEATKVVEDTEQIVEDSEVVESEEETAGNPEEPTGEVIVDPTEETTE